MSAVTEMKFLIQFYFAWFRIGLFTFGGGYAMLPLMQRELVEHYQWTSEEEMIDYFAIAQCTPGIIAANTAILVGYQRKGVIGGIVGALGVVSPSLLVITIIAKAISNFSELAIVSHALNGIQVAVCMLMINSIIKLWKSSVKSIAGVCIFAAALLLSLFSGLSMMILVIAAIVAGIVLDRMGVKP